MCVVNIWVKTVAKLVANGKILLILILIVQPTIVARAEKPDVKTLKYLKEFIKDHFYIENIML